MKYYLSIIALVLFTTPSHAYFNADCNGSTSANECAEEAYKRGFKEGQQDGYEKTKDNAETACTQIRDSDAEGDCRSAMMSLSEPY